MLVLKIIAEGTTEVVNIIERIGGVGCIKQIKSDPDYDVVFENENVYIVEIEPPE